MTKMLNSSQVKLYEFSSNSVIAICALLQSTLNEDLKKMFHDWSQYWLLCFHKASLWRLIHREPWKICHSGESSSKMNADDLVRFPAKTMKDIFPIFPRVMGAGASNPWMKKLCCTLGQGSYAIKYVDETAHSNVLNPENQLKTRQNKWPIQIFEGTCQRL